MDDCHSTESDQFWRRRKGPLAAVIEKYSKEDPEKDDIVDINELCLYEDRGSLLQKTSESQVPQALADFLLNSDIEWSSSSSTLDSSPCRSEPNVLRQLFVRLTNVGKKLPAANVQPSESDGEPFSGCGNDAADRNGDCSGGSSRSCRNCRCHNSSHEEMQQQQHHQQQMQQHETRQQQHQQHETRPQQQHQQHEARQEQHQQHETRQLQRRQRETRQQQHQQHQQHETQQEQFRVGVQSNPYFLLSPSKEQCSASRSSRTDRGASSSAAAIIDTRFVVDKPPAVEHEGVSSGSCRQVVPSNARFSSSDRRTVLGCAESYSIDCCPKAALRCVGTADGRSSAARASHSAARPRPNDCRPKCAERRSTQAVPDNTSTNLGNFTDEPALKSSLPSSTEARGPQLPFVSLEERVGRRSRGQHAKLSAASTTVAADQSTLATDQPRFAVEQPRQATSAVSALACAELGAPGVPITSRSLSSLGKLLPGEWIATYFTRFAEAAGYQSPLIFPPADPSPSLSPATATHHLTDRYSVKGSAVVDTLAAVSIPCNDAFSVAAGRPDVAERQPISRMPAGRTAADNASGAMHARHSRDRHIDREMVVSSTLCRAGGVQASRAVKVEPSGAANCQVLTPSCSRASSPTAFGSNQLCRSALPALPAAPATADDSRGILEAPHHARSRHQPSRVPHDRHDVIVISSDDDSTVEYHRPITSASSNEMTRVTRATPKRHPGCPGDQTWLSTLQSLCYSAASNPEELLRAVSATRSVATSYFPVKHDRRRRFPSDGSYGHSDLGETSANKQSELNEALVMAPDSVETTSWVGRDASPYVGDRRSSLDVASEPLPPTAFLCVEPPTGWRAGDSTPSDKAVGSVLYTPPSDFKLQVHSTATLYTPPSDFDAVQAADVQPPPLPPAEVAGSSPGISHDANPIDNPIPAGRYSESTRFEPRHPRHSFASTTALERKLSGMVRSLKAARTSIACSNDTPTQVLLYACTQSDAERLGRCSSCGGSTPAEAAHAPHLFGVASRCSYACSSDKA